MATSSGFILVLLGAGLGAAAATPVWCFTRLAEDADGGGADAEGGGACAEPLADEQLPLADCCLNPAYGYKLRPHGHCLSCRQGQWGPWTAWSHCSVTCGEGTQLRGRSRSPAGDNGDTTEWQLRACDMPCCAVPGGWSSWSPWSSCSVTCGSGVQRRDRSCSEPPPRCGGTCGSGDSQETRQCQGDTERCPVAGAWGAWGPWGSCSGSCRGSSGGSEPSRSRARRCDSPEPSRDPPGAPCEGKGAEREPCPGLPPCPVDGAWGAWSPATPCAVTCGLGGVTLRRACDSPSPKHGGRGCKGAESRRGTCGSRESCPDPLHWGPWGAWTPCARPLWGDIACRSTVGQQRRSRGCVGHRAGGPSCPTAGGGAGTVQFRACYSIQGCLLRGDWSDWSPWGLCTPPCGASPTRSRSRECRAVLPEYAPTVAQVGSTGSANVTFWGSPRPRCAELEGQRVRLEESRACRNVLPCPHPHEV